MIDFLILILVVIGAVAFGAVLFLGICEELRQRRIRAENSEISPSDRDEPT
jgi:hypothetical protein